MAVRKGRKNALSPARGAVIPTNRMLGPVGKAVVYELPEATNDVRTVARTADMSATVTQSLNVEADLRASITVHVDFGIDGRLLVIRPVNTIGDLRLVINRVLDLRPDLRSAVFRSKERAFDCALVVLHRLMTDADVKQTIYRYLFRESHEIQI